MAVLSETRLVRRQPLGDRVLRTFSVAIANTDATDEWIPTGMSTIEAVVGYVVTGTAPVTGGTVTAPVQASGTITFTAVPTATDTVTINGVVYTFIATPAAAFDVDIGADQTAVAADLAAAINAEVAGAATSFDNATKPNRYVSASAAAGVVTVTSIQPGTVGNAYTLAKSAGLAEAALSGATLTGGLDVVVDPPGVNFVKNAQGTGNAADSSHGDLAVEGSSAVTIEVTVIGKA